MKTVSFNKPGWPNTEIKDVSIEEAVNYRVCYNLTYIDGDQLENLRTHCASLEKIIARILETLPEDQILHCLDLEPLDET